MRLEATVRLTDPSDRLTKVADILNSAPGKALNNTPLCDRKLLVTAGPTREFMDPVRFFSNPSSGKMGIAMADAAYELGGEITLLTGAITEQLPPHLRSKNRSFTSAEELFNLVKEHQDEIGRASCRERG